LKEYNIMAQIPKSSRSASKTREPDQLAPAMAAGEIAANAGQPPHNSFQDVRDEIDKLSCNHDAVHGPVSKPVTVRLNQPDPNAEEAVIAAAPNAILRGRLHATSFEAYKAFIDGVFTKPQIDRLKTAGQDLLPPDATLPTGFAVDCFKPFGTVVFDVLRAATQAFLMFQCCKQDDISGTSSAQKLSDAQVSGIVEQAERLGMRADDLGYHALEFLKGQQNNWGPAEPWLPHIAKQLALLDEKGNAISFSELDKLYLKREECPLLIELIWSYWHEEGMLSQTMNSIGIRFQNRRASAGRDPLAALEIDPLRPMNNLLWGWIQNEYQRLTVQRRAYEYDHHYGLTLKGKAVPPLLSADSRSQFLESFHALLRKAHQYFDEVSDTTRIVDAFPLQNALRNLSLVLAEGAHNQFGDLPFTARVEMLIEMWIMARPEMREFLRGRAMVPYEEAWMGQVDTMKKLQGWSDVSVSHYHDLATCGEALLLSIRYGNWYSSAVPAGAAAAWAQSWKQEVQRYTFAYQAVTGVDLRIEPQDNTLPADLITRRVMQQRSQPIGVRR
jgi:hypothetical protein